MAKGSRSKKTRRARQAREKKDFFDRLAQSLPPAGGLTLQQRLRQHLDNVVRRRELAIKRKTAPRKRPQPAASSPPLAPDAPFWLPRGVHYEQLSPGLKAALQEVLAPAYRQLVLDSSDPLERAAGVSLVHTLWMELYSQDELADLIAERDSLAGLVHDRQNKIAAHLNLVAAKSNLMQLLARLRAMRQFFDTKQPAGAPALPGPAPIDVIPAAAPPAAPPRQPW